MQPIVNGLETNYGNQIDFVSLNAEDNDQGQAAFEFYALRGHPTVMLIEPDGYTVWIKTGVIAEEHLEQALREALSQSTGGVP